MISWIPNPKVLAADRAEIAGSSPTAGNAMRAVRMMARAGDPNARALSSMLLGVVDISSENRAILEGTRD